MQLLHTMIRVNDMDESIKFYTEGLGMKLLRKQDYPGVESSLWPSLATAMKRTIQSSN